MPQKLIYQSRFKKSRLETISGSSGDNAKQVQRRAAEMHEKDMHLKKSCGKVGVRMLPQGGKELERSRTDVREEWFRSRPFDNNRQHELVPRNRETIAACFCGFGPVPRQIQFITPS